MVLRTIDGSGLVIILLWVGYVSMALLRTLICQGGTKKVKGKKKRKRRRFFMQLPRCFIFCFVSGDSHFFHFRDFQQCRFGLVQMMQRI